MKKSHRTTPVENRTIYHFLGLNYTELQSMGAEVWNFIKHHMFRGRCHLFVYKNPSTGKSTTVLGFGTAKRRS